MSSTTHFSTSPSVSIYSLRQQPAGTPFEGIFVVQRSSSKTARTGSPFLMLELRDRSGHFTTMVFGDAPFFDLGRTLKEGDFVTIQGTCAFYQEKFSPKLQHMQLVALDQVEASGALQNLVAASPENLQVLQQTLQEGIASIPHPQLRQTVLNAFTEIGPWFYECPAAISMHHAYRHGLLEHTVHLLRITQALLPLYPQVHASLALAGVLLHDIGKTLEYEGLVQPKRTPLGLLQGHVVLGYRLVRKAALQAKLEDALLERLEHIILSHQGELEWGAAAMAATPEAVFVSMIDNLDAKMGMVQQALRETPTEEVFSEYLLGLKARIMVTPPEPHAYSP